MILVDTSIWIDFLNRGDVALEAMLNNDAVMMHRYVYAEIALGSLRDRTQRLSWLRDLHHVPMATDAEVLAMIEWHQLYSTGVSFIDVHLLAAVTAADPEFELVFWTRDKRLGAQAERLGVAYEP
jgi:predicted nucleic acid-binding protein